MTAIVLAILLATPDADESVRDLPRPTATATKTATATTTAVNWCDPAVKGCDQLARRVHVPVLLYFRIA